MTDPYKTFASLLGRFLLALMFITAGFDKLTHIEATAGYVASGGLPFPTLLAAGAGALEFFGGIALVVGWQVRWAGLALALFTLVASVVFHPYWSVLADQQFVTQLLFMKNLSVAGGLWLVSALGAGPLSVDGARRKS